MAHVHEALPEGLRSMLRDVWTNNQLSREPTLITTESALEMYLHLQVPEFTGWGTVDPVTDEERFPGSKPVEVLFKEFREGECILSLVDWGPKQYILRDLRTAALTVLSSYPSPTPTNPRQRTPVWLREYHLKGGEKRWRKHRNSMSEKLLPDETFYDGAVRAIRQELSLAPAPEYLRPPYLFELSQYRNITMLEQEKSAPFIYRPDVRHTTRYPGLLTRNHVEQFIWCMPPEFFQEQYHEPGTDHYFEWVGVTANDMERDNKRGSLLK